MTAEQIAQKYTWHIVITRWFACWFDLIILFLLFLIPLILNIDISSDFFGIWIIIACLYYTICEGYFGCTLGKLISGIRVVDNELNSPGFLKALIRTIFRFIEVNPIIAGGIPAGIIVLTSRTRQRLGDRIAQTYVLRIDDIIENYKRQLPTEEKFHE